MDTLGQHLRYVVRSLMKAPSFTLLTGLFLALGIAGTTVMIALIQGVLRS